jgi:PleD family two-component response regulator
LTTSLDKAWPDPRPDTAEAGKPLALVVDDNADLNRFVGDSLAEHFRTESASNGREGLEKTQALRPDIVLGDVMMPRMWRSLPCSARAPWSGK